LNGSLYLDEHFGMSYLTVGPGLVLS
jgi:hypothetical protein